MERHQNRFVLRLSSLPLLLLSTILLLAPAALAQNDDSFCGLNWIDASDSCPYPCPTGRDSECSSALGSDAYGCFYFTGCSEKYVRVTDQPTGEPTTSAELGSRPTSAPVKAGYGSFCGSDYLEAMLTCDSQERGEAATPCPDGNECLASETCHSMDCTVPLMDMKSELIIQMNGVSNTMSGDDQDQFIETISELLEDHLEKLNIQFEGMEVTRQQLGPSFDYIDVFLSVTAIHRPVEGEPSQSLSKILEEYVNKSRMTVLSRLKTSAIMSGSDFFMDLKKIGAGLGSTEDPTVSPTNKPTSRPTTGGPTRTPTPKPTRRPSERPTDFPSGMPSASPSRSYLQSVLTEYTSKELQSLTSTSYGYLFNVRTTSDGPAVFLTGLDFYTASTGAINYELWSRIGTYDGFKGAYEGWDLLASGTIEGMGTGQYTSIPEEAFTPVSMSGGGDSLGGTRALYLTLNTNDLIYQEIANNGASGFASGATEADTKSHASTPELEIYQGEAVLSYPFPDPSEAYFYRAPQEFAGAIHYDRLPCKPLSMYGLVQELPCPVGIWPTESPTIRRPTGGSTSSAPIASPVAASVSPVAASADIEEYATLRPTLAPISSKPTISPVSSPTLSPTISHAPTISFSPTNHPTSSPVEPMRANFVMNLQRNSNSTPSSGEGEEEKMMNREEVGVFLDMFTDFLNGYAGDRMVVERVDLWHQHFILADDNKMEGDATNSGKVNVIAATNAQVASRSVLQQKKQRQKETKTTLMERTRAGETTPQINALQLIFILRVSFTTLPPEMIGSMTVAVLQENHIELLERINGLAQRHPYFESINGILDVYEMEKLELPTLPPAMDSSVGAQVNDTTSEESENELEDKLQGPSIGVVIGIIIGIFWLCLAAIALVYVRMARSRMSGVKATETLMKQDLDPIKHDPTLVSGIDQPALTVPMGGADWGNVTVDDSVSVSNRSAIRSIGAKGARLSQSMITERVKSRVPENDTSRLTHSDVVTAKEREMMLEGEPINLRSSLSRPKQSHGIGVRGQSFDLGDDEQKSNTTSTTAQRGFNRRNQLSRSDSQINIDTSTLDAPLSNPKNNLRRSMVLTSYSNDLKKSLVDKQFEAALIFDYDLPQKRGDASASADTTRSNLKNSLRKSAVVNSQNNNLRKSLIDKEFEAALLDGDFSSSQTSGGNLRTSFARAKTQQINNLRKSLIDKELIDKEFEAALLDGDFSSSQTSGGNLRTSMTLSNPQNNLRSSSARSNPQQNNNLRKSLIDKEFEEALKDEIGLGIDGVDSQASLDRSDTRKGANLRSSFVQSNKQHGNDEFKSYVANRWTPKSRHSQSMKVTGADYGDLLKDGTQQSLLKRSFNVPGQDMTKNASGDLRQSGTRKALKGRRRSSGETEVDDGDDNGGSAEVSSRAATGDTKAKENLGTLKKSLKAKNASSDLRKSGKRKALKGRRRSSMETEVDDGDSDVGSVEMSNGVTADDTNAKESRGALKKSMKAKNASSDLRKSGTRKALKGRRRSSMETEVDDGDDNGGNAEVSSMAAADNTKANENLGTLKKSLKAKNASSDLRASGSRKSAQDGLRKSMTARQAYNVGSMETPSKSITEDSKVKRNLGTLRSSFQQGNPKILIEEKVTSTARRRNKDGHGPVSQSMTIPKSSGTDRLATLTRREADQSRRLSNDESTGDSKREDANNRSGENKSPLRKSRNKVKDSSGDLQRLEREGKDDTRLTDPKRVPSGKSRPLSKSNTASRTRNAEINPLRSRRSSDSLQKMEREGRDEGRRKTSRQSVDNSRPLSRSITTSRTNAEAASLRRSTRKDSRDNNLGSETRNDPRRNTRSMATSETSRPLRKSMNASRMNGDVASSLRKSRARGSSDNVQRLVGEARQQTGDRSRELSQGLAAPRTSGEMTALRQSARRSSMENTPSSGDGPPRALSRTRPRSTSFDDLQKLDDQFAPRRTNTRRGNLSQSMKVARKGNDSALRRSAKIHRGMMT